MTSPSKRILLLLAILFPATTFASYCGQAAIPFSFQALTNGQPVLGCARPSCFGWRSDGTRAADSAQFFKIFKRPDGFLRKTDIKNRDSLDDSVPFVPQFAKCENQYTSSECDLSSQWVGGVGPATNVTDQPIKLQCCTYTKLKDFSTERGEAEVRPGQIVIGGEVAHDGRQFGFDYIANIRREVDNSGNVVYTVAMKRFPCLPDPSRNTKMEPVDSQVRDYLLENIGDKPKKSFDQQKFDLPEHMPSERVHQHGDFSLLNNNLNNEATNIAPKDATPEQVQVTHGGMKPVQRGITQIKVDPAQMPVISDSATFGGGNPRVPTARVYENDNLNVQKIDTKASANNGAGNNGFNNNNYNNNGFNNGYNGFDNGQNGYNQNQNFNNGFNNGFNTNQNNGFNNNQNNGFNNNNQNQGFNTNQNNGFNTNQNNGFNNNNQNQGFNNNQNQGFNTNQNNGFNNNGFNNNGGFGGFGTNNGFPAFSPLPMFPLHHQMFPTLAPATFNGGSNGGFTPQPIRIPSPEDVLPPAGRSLITNMARTFLGQKALHK